MKNSKKGITLVELIICCTIIVLLGGACTAVLASSATVFNQSSSTANAQLDSDVLQNFLMNIIPSAKTVGVLSDTDSMNDSAKYLFFDDENDGLFTVRIEGTDTTIRSITKFEYSIVRAGAEGSTNARAQFQYTATLDDGSKISGGFILSNVKFASVISGDLAEDPVGFNIPAPAVTE